MTPPKLHAKIKLDLFFRSIKASKEISEANLQKASEGKKGDVEDAATKSRMVAIATGVGSIDGCGGEIILSYIASLYSEESYLFI